MAGHRYQFAGLHRERDVFQGIVAARIAFAHLAQANHAKKASTNSLASNGRKSSSFSPMPIKQTGTGRDLAIAAIAPPLAVPSSLVMMSPVKSNASSNALT